MVTLSPTQNGIFLTLGEVVIVGQGQIVLASPGPATFQVTAVAANGLSVTLKSMQFPGDVAPGTAIDFGDGSGRAWVSPAGQGFVGPVAIGVGGTGQVTAAAAARALTARVRLLGLALGVNLNAANNTDVQIPIAATKYIVTSVLATNASISLTTAKVGLFTAAGAGGTAIVSAATVLTALTAATKFANLALNAGGGGPQTDTQSASPLFLNLSTQQGAAATADFYVFGQDLS